MTKLPILLLDLGAVLLFPKDRSFKGKLNPIYAEKSKAANFKFFDYFELNTEFLSFLYSLKQKEAVLFMITEGSIQNAPEIKTELDKVFSKVYSGKKMGFSKKDPNLYETLANELTKSTAEILFIDANEGNLKAAARAGMKTIQYTSNKEVIKTLDSILQ